MPQIVVRILIMREREFVELTGFYYCLAGLLPDSFLPILRKSFLSIKSIIFYTVFVFFDKSLFHFLILAFILSIFALDLISEAVGF